MDVKMILDAITFREEKMAKVNLFETANFFCDLYCLEPGQSQRVHTHAENDKLYSIVIGEGKVTIGSEERVVTEGEIVLARAGEPHGIENVSDDRLVVLVFMAPHPSWKGE